MAKIEINQKAPDFSISTFQGETFRLADRIGKKHQILVFNRGFV